MIGVKSPTTLSKAQLDEAVRLRELELGLSNVKHSIYDFTASERHALIPNLRAKTRIQMYSGYFVPFKEGDGVLRRDPFFSVPETDVYVTKKYVDENNMRVGDRIVGSVSYAQFNNTRILKSVKYINEESTSHPIKRLSFDDLERAPVAGAVETGGNNALVGIIQDIVCLGKGQSLSVSGYNPNNRELFERAAIDLLKGLNIRFDGVVYGIFENLLPDNKTELDQCRNPETLLYNGSAEQYEYMLEMMKRSIERGENAVIVIFAPDYDVKIFLEAARAVGEIGLTVIAFTAEEIEAEAKIHFQDSIVVADKLSNPKASLVCTINREKRRTKALKKLRDTDPDSLLSEFTELANE